MCELARLPMVICSEVIETISLSGYSKLSDGTFNASKTLMSKYKNRRSDPQLSFHEYFHLTKNQGSKKSREYVPHYVGGSGQPVFPISENYARIELMKHKPWNSENDLPPLTNVIEEFERFLQNPICPITVKLSYERAKLKYNQRLRGQKEAVSNDQEESNPMCAMVYKDTRDTLAVCNNIGEVTNEIENMENSGLFTGKDFNWSRRLYEVRFQRAHGLINTIFLTISQRQHPSGRFSEHLNFV